MPKKKTRKTTKILVLFVVKDLEVMVALRLVTVINPVTEHDISDHRKASKIWENEWKTVNWRSLKGQHQVCKVPNN